MSLKPAKPNSLKRVGMGAAFLMATSAIGPGFLTQTTLFTSQLRSSFGFVILITILLDIGAQLNIWRILVVSGKKAQDLANTLLPGLGYMLAATIGFGGLAFNIGNIGGAGLGLNALTGIDPVPGAILSGLFAIGIFWFGQAGNVIDRTVQVLGLLMIALTLYIAFSAHPPVTLAIRHTFFPAQTSTLAIITLVGGTVGGYISFAGAHRLLDAGVHGTAALPQVNRSAITGILLTSAMRFALFMAALGVITGGALLDATNPAASVFSAAAGQLGYRFFGLVMWCASVTSIIGAAYTSVSFLRSFHTAIEKNHRRAITLFIMVSAIVFVWIGRPVKVLVAAGAINGIILPAGLAIVLVAALNKKLVAPYRHPLWMSIAGWIVVLAMGWLAVKTILEQLG